MIDWIWSTAFYSAALLALAGALGVIWPLRWLHRKSRLRALVMLVGGVVVVVIIAVITPSPQSSAARERHRRVHARVSFSRASRRSSFRRPRRVSTMPIKSVSADEIALFNLFTSIRRFGRPGPESILNAPGTQPILDVAIRTGFPAAARSIRHPTSSSERWSWRRPASGPARHVDTGADFMALTQPGFGKATMNFRIDDLGNGTTRVDTETRVLATDTVALKRFTPYWRTIFPGSWILRATWLRAIKTRAEKASS